jgi:hypothetical protein
VDTFGQSQRIIFHHTDGHGGGATKDAAKAYARAIQNYHMDSNGWNDSGHNFLVMRSGFILQGRWHTVSRIENRKMVFSAHCPGQNQNIGIEHEHVPGENMTANQRKASARLQAWIADQYKLQTVLPVYPHSKYFPTSCPSDLIGEIPIIKRMAQTILATER